MERFPITAAGYARMEAELKELEHQALRLQMNPHFIFNSLASISNFIGKNDAAEAKRYLTKFAKLMRLILENSREEFIPLTEEIDSLTYYMELEQLRFRDKFSFEINTDPSIDREHLFIPPMLIQPHIENAILHGMAPKETKGMILISFERTEGLLRCVVEDNGVGRKRAAEIKARTKTQHTSLAMKIIFERLSILFPGKNKINIITEDLEDENKNAIGTRVLFNLPCRDHLN